MGRPICNGIMRYSEICGIGESLILTLVGLRDDSQGIQNK